MYERNTARVSHSTKSRLLASLFPAPITVPLERLFSPSPFRLLTTVKPTSRFSSSAHRQMAESATPTLNFPRFLSSKFLAIPRRTRRITRRHGRQTSVFADKEFQLDNVVRASCTVHISKYKYKSSKGGEMNHRNYTHPDSNISVGVGESDEN